MKTLLLLPIVAAIMMLAIGWHPFGGTRYNVNVKFNMAFATVPVFVVLALFWTWIRNRRIRTSLLWVAAVILIGGIAIGVNLLMLEPGRSGGLQPGERYDWSGWYWMYPGVVYMMCWVTVVWIIGAWCTKGVWRGVRKAVNPQTVVDLVKDP